MLAKVRNLSYLPIDDKFYGLDETEIELRQTTRHFFETEVGPHAYQIDKDDHYPEFRTGFLSKFSQSNPRHSQTVMIHDGPEVFIPHLHREVRSL